MLKGFKDFIFRGNVVDLAVAVVIGGAFGKVVTALVNDLVTPLIAAIGGKPDFSGIYFTINTSKFMIGDFVNAITSFAIVAAVIYFFVVIPMEKVMGKIQSKKVAAPTEKLCSECLSSIPLKAKRCKFCTAVQKK